MFEDVRIVAGRAQDGVFAVEVMVRPDLPGDVDLELDVVGKPRWVRTDFVAPGAEDIGLAAEGDGLEGVFTGDGTGIVAEFAALVLVGLPVGIARTSSRFGRKALSF